MTEIEIEAAAHAQEAPGDWEAKDDGVLAIEKRGGAAKARLRLDPGSPLEHDLLREKLEGMLSALLTDVWGKSKTPRAAGELAMTVEIVPPAFEGQPE